MANPQQRSPASVAALPDQLANHQTRTAGRRVHADSRRYRRQSRRLSCGRRCGRRSDHHREKQSRDMERPARETAWRAEAGHHLRIGDSRQRCDCTGEVRFWSSRREVCVLGGLREFARRRRHGALSRSAARVPSSGRHGQVPRRVDQHPGYHRPHPAGDGGRRQSQQAQSSIRCGRKSDWPAWAGSFPVLEDIRRRAGDVPNRDRLHGRCRSAGCQRLRKIGHVHEHLR